EFYEVLAARSTGLRRPVAVFLALCVNAPGDLRFRERAADIFAARATAALLFNRSPSTLPQRSCLELPEHLEPNDAWREVRAELRRAVGESTWEIWLDPLEVKSLQGNLLSLTAPPSTLSWVAQRFGRLLDTSAQTVLGPDARVSLHHHGDAPARGRTPSSSHEPREDGDTLNPRFSFEQFIIGDSNRLAHAAALAVAELPGEAYNPLFLHAPPGLGKTHLLHAIGNYVRAFGA